LIRSRIFFIVAATFASSILSSNVRAFVAQSRLMEQIRQPQSPFGLHHWLQVSEDWAQQMAVLVAFRTVAFIFFL
jgi:hypothetical protein